MNAEAEAIAEPEVAETEMSAAGNSIAEAAPLPAGVLELIQPIGEAGAGEDPRYSDRFALIKQEIDRLSDVDFERVMNLSKEVLISEGKDLRVAGYLILSTLYCRGLSGFTDSITVYRMILENFWDGCFPIKSGARTQSFVWLNSDRMETFIQQQNGEAASLEDLQRLRTEIDLLNKMASQRMGDEAPQWTRVNAWVDSNLKEKLSQKNNREQAQKQEEQQQSQTQSVQEERLRQSASSDAPLTESRAEQQIGKIITFYRERGERAQSVALSRAIRWGGLLTPPNEAGLTRIPPFRANAMNELSVLQSSGAPLDQVFALSENLLMEPGGQWNMDLQHIAHQILTGLNDQASLHVLEAEINSLLKRCTGLADLSYSDRTPFASDATKEWLKSLETSAGPQEEEPSASEEGNGIKEIAIEATKACSGGNLVAGLEILKAIPDSTGRQRFIRRIEEAKLYIKTKNTDHAMSMLESLDREIQRIGMDTWEPGMAIAVWRLQLQLLALELPKANSTQQQEIKNRMKEINGAICMADPYEAARLIRTTNKKGAKHG